jgi:multiple sugar transport system substrate-binding protein
MTNEFMRFLITNDELNNMAAIKGLMATTKEVSFDSVYAPFAQVPADRTFSPEILGVKDSLVKQLRNAAFKVGKGEITVDDAISMFGTF